MRAMQIMRLLAIVGGFTAEGLVVHAQTTAPIPPAMTECEPEGCLTLRFHDGKAEARWGNGAIGNLTVESYDGHTIRIKREDIIGPSAGLHGEYTGTHEGNGWNGKMTWTWPGHGSLASGTLDWKATLWATAEPVRIGGIEAQKMGTQCSQLPQWGGCGNGPSAFGLGTIEAELIVSPDGKVIDVKDIVNTVQAPFCRDVRTIANISAWQFKPYLVEGKPTAMRVTVHVHVERGQFTCAFK